MRKMWLVLITHRKYKQEVKEPRDTPEVIPGNLIEIVTGTQQLHGPFK